MLVLSRKCNQEIVIGDDIKITVVRVQGNKVRLGVEAPQDVAIIRGELNVDEQPLGNTFEVEINEPMVAHH